MHSFFAFPFQWTPLCYLLFLSAASLLGLGLGLTPAIVLVELGIALAVCRYAFRVIQQISRGLLHSRDFMTDWESSHKSLPWKLFGVLFVWGVVAGAVGSVHPVLAMWVNLMLSFVLPAIVITMAQDGSFAQSVNPASWWRVMRGVGPAYLALFFFVMLLSQGSGTVLIAVAPLIKPVLLLPVANAVLIYFSLVTAALLGYVMYQHHEALGIDLQRDPRSVSEGSRGASSQSRETDRHVSEMVTSGNLQHALDVAYEAQRQNPEDVRAHARYHQVLTLSEKTDALGHHAARYIPLLLKNDLTRQAVDVWVACRDRDVTVSLDNPEHLLALARHQFKQGEAQAALSAVQDFEKKYPGHALVPAAMEFCVRVLVQGLHQKDQALTWVKTLEARYPTSAHTEEARWLAR